MPRVNLDSLRALGRGQLSPRSYGALALLLGSLYLVVNPPFAVNDEDVHLFRLYELAGGQLFTRSDAQGEYHYVPRDFQRLAERYQRVTPQNEGRVSATELIEQLAQLHAEPERVRVTARASGYFPSSYHLQLPVVWLARKLELSAFWHVYLARCAALLVYLALTARAVLIAGALRWPIAAVALMPMALTQAAGVSADGFVIGLSLLFFSHIARAGVLDGPAATRGALAELMICLTLLTLAKPVYVVAGLALPVLRWPGARAWLYRWLAPALAIALAAGAFVLWSHLKIPYEEPANPAFSGSAQLALLLREPLRIAALLADTALRFSEELLLQSIFVRYRVSPFMRFAAGLGSVLYAQLLLMLAWGSARSNAKAKAPRERHLQRFLLASTWLALIGAPALGLYLCCTEIGWRSLHGLHGRYLIPAFPALLLCLALIGRPLFARWLLAKGQRAPWLLIAGINLLCLFSLLGFHYYPPRVEWPL